MKTRKRLLTGALLGALGLLGWFLVRGERSERQTESRADVLEKVARLSTAVNEYAAQKAARPLPPLDLQKQRQYQALVDKALDVKGAILAGDWKWSRTALHIEDPGFAADKRLACDRTLGKEVSRACNYRVDMVLEPSAEGLGKVVYSRAVLVDAAPEPICSHYIECQAQTRLEERLPLPPGSGSGEVAISQKISAAHPNPAMLDPARMDRIVGAVKEAVETMRKKVDLADPRAVHEIQRHEAILRYAEKRHQERKAALAAVKATNEEKSPR